MEITRKNWQTYIDNLAKADDKAAALVLEYLETHEIISEKGFQAFVDYFHRVVTKYSTGASEMAAQAYELLAEAQGAFVSSAVPAETPSLGECIKAIRGTMLDSDQAKSLGQAAGRLVRRTGVDTTLSNSLRDGAEYAWVPSGDTCVYCMWLASLGWMKASKKSLKEGHARHIHANCDCTYAVRFDNKSTVEGYDPDYYKAIFEAAEGDTPKEKRNAVRRAQRKENKEVINAQKRDNYAKKKEEREKMLGQAESLLTKYDSIENLYLFGSKEDQDIYAYLREKGIDFDKIKKKDIIEKKKINFRQIDESEWDKYPHSITAEQRAIIYGRGHFSGYVNSSNAKRLNAALRNGEELSEEFKRLKETLTDVIEANVMPENLEIIRYVKADALPNIAGINPPTPNLLNPYTEEIKRLCESVKAGYIDVENQFLSASLIPEKNVMTHKGVEMHIKVPEGMPCYITTNQKESEVIFGIGTELELESINYDTSQRPYKYVINYIMRMKNG